MRRKLEKLEGFPPESEKHYEFNRAKDRSLHFSNIFLDRYEIDRGVEHRFNWNKSTITKK